MASVTLTLGAPTENSSSTWVQWDNRTGPDGLGDISALSADSDTRKLIRVRLFYDGRIQFQTVQTADGSSGFGTSEELSERWEKSLVAFTLSGDSLPTIVVAGPNSSAATQADSTEPYGWTVNGATALAERRAFISALTASAAVLLTSVTAVIDDDFLGVEVVVAVPQPTVTLVLAPAAHTVDASAVNVAIVVPEPTVTLVLAPAVHTVDAGAVNVTIVVPEPTITLVLAPSVHIVDAHAVEVTVAVPQPTVTLVPKISGLLSVVTPDIRGTSPNFVNAGSSGDSFTGRKHISVRVKNEHSSDERIVTFKAHGKCNFNVETDEHDAVITIPSNDEREIGKFNSPRFSKNRPDRRVAVNYDNVSDVKVSVINRR